MWGSLSLGTLRDAAAKIKDGLEAQMDEAMTNAGPRVSRSSLNAELGSSGEGAAGEDNYGSSAGRATTASLSPVAKIPGLQLIGGWGGAADESAFGDDGGSVAHPKTSDPGVEGGARFLADEHTSRGYTRASSGMASPGRSSWSPGEHASPPTRPSSNEGFSDMAGAYALGGNGTGGIGQAESARERRERMRRERLERFDKKGSAKDRDTRKDAPKLMWVVQDGR